MYFVVIFIFLLSFISIQFMSCCCNYHTDMSSNFILNILCYAFDYQIKKTWKAQTSV